MPDLDVEIVEFKDPRSEELLKEAQEDMNDLEQSLEAQREGDLEEGEKLSATEIEQRREAIDAKRAQVEAYESMSSWEELAERLEESPEDFSDQTKYILANGEKDREDVEEEGSVFGDSSLDFLKACVAASGMDVDYEWTEERAKTMKALQSAATTYNEHGERVGETDLDPKDIKDAFSQKALQGDNNTALVPTPHMERLLRVMAEDQVFANRATQIPMQRRDVTIPRLDQTDMSNNLPIFSIADVTVVGEGAQKPEREPSFQELTLTAHKYAAYTEISDELLAESIIDVEDFVTENLMAATGYKFDLHCMTGDGSTKPQGVIGSAAEWQQNRGTAGEVNLADITGLEERFFGTNGRYYMHPTVFSELVELAESNVITFNDDVSAEAPGTLLGRPIQRSFKMAKLGNDGDLGLWDPSAYLVGNLQQMTIATSTDFRFRNDLTSVRSVFRAGGQPWPNGLFSHEASSGSADYRISPFATMYATASS